MSELIRRELITTIPNTHLAQYIETYADGHTEKVEMSYLWDNDPKDLEYSKGQNHV